MSSPDAAHASPEGRFVSTQSIGFGTRPYRTYVLNAFLLVAILNFTDRQLLSVLSEPVMTELKLTDGDLGWLTGPAFAIFNAVFSVLLARWADTRNRVALVGIFIALWSLATIGTGSTRSFDIAGFTVSGFAMLFVMRTLVGAAEAGSAPANSSLIADYYAPADRAVVYGYLAAGAYLGIVAANLLVGTLAVGQGWRMSILGRRPA